MNKGYILLSLADRVERLVTLRGIFKKRGMSHMLYSRFGKVISNGAIAYDAVRDGSIDLLTGAKVVMFLEQSVDIIGAVVFELPEEYCDLYIVAETFLMENDLIRKLLDGDLDI